MRISICQSLGHRATYVPRTCDVPASFPWRISDVSVFGWNFTFAYVRRIKAYVLLTCDICMAYVLRSILICGVYACVYVLYQTVVLTVHFVHAIRTLQLSMMPPFNNTYKRGVSVTYLYSYGFLLSYVHSYLRRICSRICSVPNGCVDCSLCSCNSHITVINYQRSTMPPFNNTYKRGVSVTYLYSYGYLLSYVQALFYVRVTYVWRMKCTHDVSAAYALRSILICGVYALYQLLINILIMHTVRIKINVECVLTILLCTRFPRVLILTSHSESNL